MKRVIWTGLVAGAIGLLAVGCSDQPVAPPEGEAELRQLIQRTKDLKAEVAAEGKMTPARQLALSILVQDLNAWRERTGRDDISAKTGVRIPSNQSGKRQPMTAPRESDGEACGPCPAYKVEADRICFLVEDGGDCIDEEDISIKVCTYTCIYIGSDDGRAIRKDPVAEPPAEGKVSR
jgi:hypothetical protein